MKSFEMELVVKGSSTILKEGFSPGGVVKQTVTFDVSDEEAAKALFAVELHRKMEDFLRESVEVRLTALD